MNVKLGKLEVHLGDNETVHLDLDEIVPIDDDIDVEFTQQPSRYAYVAMVAARSEAQASDAKNYVAEIYAQTDREVRSDLDGQGIKITEARVNSEVLLRRGYSEAKEYQQECYEQHLVMRVVTRALEMRADMLVSLGAHLRAEASQTGMYIRTDSDKLAAHTKKSLHEVQKQPYKVKGHVPEVNRILSEDEFDPAQLGF